VSLHDGTDCIMLIFFEDADVAPKVISSLRGPALNWPAKATLTPHVQPSSSVRARLTESTDNPVPTTRMASFGLDNGPPGPVRSKFIGDDRRA